MQKILFSFLLFCASVSCLHAQKPAISDEIVEDILKSIPSPLEISFLIKDLEIVYNKSLLTPTESIKNAKTPFQQAFLLGVLSTDVGYAQIYAEPEALTSLEACQKISQALQIDSVIDFKVLRTTYQNTKNFDESLFFEQIKKANTSLQKKSKQELMTVMLTSGWLKSFNIICEIYTKYPNEILKARISEQRIILEQLLLLLSFYDEDIDIKKLVGNISQLTKIYQSAEKNPNSLDIKQIHQQTKKILQEILEEK